jgi:uncharacterized protein YcnI
MPLRDRRIRLGLTLAIAACAFAAASPVASAHVQVAPTIAAPGDSVKFVFLVPGESSVETTKVVLKVPADVLPFSFDDPPGWTRKNVLASNGAIDQVEWTGRLAVDGFVEFAFLAGTPEQPGVIEWKALQTYADGTTVRWIGPPGSEEPAATTEISADAPRQNAGGEGEEAGGGPATTEPATTTTSPGATTVAAAETSSDEGDDGLARGLALLGLVVAIAALALGLLRKPRSRG